MKGNIDWERILICSQYQRFFSHVVVLSTTPLPKISSRDRKPEILTHVLSEEISINSRQNVAALVELADHVLQNRTEK